MRTITKAIVQLFIVVQIFVFAGVANAQTKVACIGDSITQMGWPTILGEKLGAGYNVGNFGMSGTNMCKGGLQSYWDSAQYTPSHDFAPDIVVIMHGTNDSTTITWPNCASHFAADYEAFIDTYTSLSSHPKVYLNTPPPVGAAVFGQQEPVIENEIIPAIKEVAKKKGCTVIDVWAAFGGTSYDTSLMGSDNLHPTAAGQEVIADTVYDVLMSPDDGGKAGKGGSAGSGGSAKAGGGGKKAGGSGNTGGGGKAGGSANTGSSANIGGSASLTGAGGSANASGNSNSNVNAIAAAGTSAPMVSSPESSSSGCGCRMAGNNTSKSGQAAVLLLLLGIAIGRRRRDDRAAGSCDHGRRN